MAKSEDVNQSDADIGPGAPGNHPRLVHIIFILDRF